MDKEKPATYTCAHCGATFPRGELYAFDGALYCWDCLTELTAVCDHCGQRLREDGLHREQGLTLCGSYLDDYLDYESPASGRLTQ